METLKKRTYHVWRNSQLRQLEQSYLHLSDRELAHLYGTTPEAIEILRRRLHLKRPKPYYYFSPGQLPLTFHPKPTVPTAAIKKKKGHSLTKEFIKEEEKYLAPTLELVQELTPLVKSGKYSQVTKRLDEVPYEQYSYMLDKCDPPKKTLRDCLTASLRWVFRVLDARTDKVNIRDLQMLSESMERKCGFC
jgi:hypothetical protein